MLPKLCRMMRWNSPPEEFLIYLLRGNVFCVRDNDRATGTPHSRLKTSPSIQLLTFDFPSKFHYQSPTIPCGYAITRHQKSKPNYPCYMYSNLNFSWLIFVLSLDDARGSQRLLLILLVRSRYVLSVKCESQEAHVGIIFKNGSS